MNKEEKLLGDEVEEFIKKIGADKLAEAYEEATNKDCGCEKRKEWLNDIHRKWKELNTKQVILNIIKSIKNIIGKTNEPKKNPNHKITDNSK